jgi:hypothetical protein
MSVKNPIKQFFQKLIDSKTKKKSAKQNFDVEKWKNHLKKSCHNFEAMEGVIRNSSQTESRPVQRQRVASDEEITESINDTRKLQRGLMRKTITQSSKSMNVRRELHYSKGFTMRENNIYKQPDESYFVYLVI